MSIWEWLANIGSVIVFAILAYRLLQVMYSMPYRRRLLMDVHACVAQFRRAAEEQLQLVHDGKCTLDALRSRMDQLVVQVYDPCQTMAMMCRVIALRLKKNDRSADSRFGDWFETVSCDFTSHYGLANLATELGMLGTVAGGIFAFGHIGTSDDPFAAFPSLALAMLTTAAGLVIAILVKFVLGLYGTWMNNLVRFTNRTIEDLVDLYETTQQMTVRCDGCTDRSALHDGSILQNA